MKSTRKLCVPIEDAKDSDMQIFKCIRKWIFIGFATLAACAVATKIPYAQQSQSPAALKIALLPIVDVFPYYVAEAMGYFDQYGANVRAVPVASGLERDQLMQSGEIDGMLNELISTANFNRERIQVKTVLAARKAYPHYPLFRVLSSPGTKLGSPSDVKGIAIGIAKNTIIEYVTDRLLAAEGADPQKILKTSIPIIPERYQLLLQGQIKAATLPDPLAKSAITAGAGIVVNDSKHPQFSVSVLTFSINALQKKAAALRRFLKAWDRAAADINADAEAFRPLLLQKIRVPKNVRDTYEIPPYPRREVPDANQWSDVMNWMIDKKLLNSALPYEDSISTKFLPSQ
jgi:NitT/TauT family transport system substrate-binding protein